MLWALSWEEGVSRQCKTREAGAESSLGHTIVLGKSMSSAGMLGEESLWAYTCLHHVTSVSPININIGKFHCRVTCQCGPAAVAKLQHPSRLDRLG